MVVSTLGIVIFWANGRGEDIFWCIDLSPEDLIHMPEFRDGGKSKFPDSRLAMLITKATGGKYHTVAMARLLALAPEGFEPGPLSKEQGKRFNKQSKAAKKPKPQKRGPLPLDQITVFL